MKFICYHLLHSFRMARYRPLIHWTCTGKLKVWMRKKNTAYSSFLCTHVFCYTLPVLHRLTNVIKLAPIRKTVLPGICISMLNIPTKQHFKFYGFVFGDTLPTQLPHQFQKCTNGLWFGFFIIEIELSAKLIWNSDEFFFCIDVGSNVFCDNMRLNGVFDYLPLDIFSEFGIRKKIIVKWRWEWVSDWA